MHAPPLDPLIDLVSGRQINLFEPHCTDITIADIAHSLAMQCRFAGHCRYHYSIAQHSLLVAQLCPPEYWLCGLLHDASEAYLVDLARPIKHHPSLLVYQQMEDRLMAVIAGVFGFAWPMPPEVKLADDLAFWLEGEALMHQGFHAGKQRPDFSSIQRIPQIKPMSPQKAEFRFLRAYLDHVHQRPDPARPSPVPPEQGDLDSDYLQKQGLQVQTPQPQL